MKFFVLQNPQKGLDTAVTDFLSVDGSRTGSAPQCEVCGRFLGMLPLLPPIQVELEGWGLRWGDVAFGPGDQILVSDKLKVLFVSSGLVGFTQFDPVEVVRIWRRKAGIGAPLVYWLATIGRGSAVLDQKASEIVRDDPRTCQECFMGGIIKRIGPIALRENTWSGEDVFYARGLPGTILVSGRFADLCGKNGLANCALFSADEYGFDFYPQQAR